MVEEKVQEEEEEVWGQRVVGPFQLGGGGLQSIPRGRGDGVSETASFPSGLR